MMNYADEIKKSAADPRRAACCLIIDTRGSTPRKIGARMIVYEDGEIRGTIGGGALEEQVMRDALAVLKSGDPQKKKYDLLHQLNMCCGGSVEVFIEPLIKPERLFIFGAGHTGKALSKLALELGFEIYLADTRFDYLSAITDERINKLTIFYDHSLAALPLDERSYVCIMTHDHASDREILMQCLKKEPAYLGMIGSRRKVEVTRKIFLEAGIPAERLERVDMPMGLSIDAEGPEEIAVSILARLIAVRNKRKKCLKGSQL